MRTQVGIVGAGPAGLTLAHLLHLEGIESVVLEDRSREYVEARIRAGVLEQGTADLLVGAGVGERLQREGFVHRGIELQFDGERHRIAFDELTGKAIVIYGQTEVVKDLIRARLAAGRPLLFEVEDVTVHFFAVKEENAGQRAVPKLTEGVIAESACTLDFHPADKNEGELTFTIDQPGCYLFRVETIGATAGPAGHEDFAALDVKAR